MFWVNIQGHRYLHPDETACSKNVVKQDTFRKGTIILQILFQYIRGQQQK